MQRRRRKKKKTKHIEASETHLCFIASSLSCKTLSGWKKQKQKQNQSLFLQIQTNVAFPQKEKTCLVCQMHLLSSMGSHTALCMYVHARGILLIKHSVSPVLSCSLDCDELELPCTVFHQILPGQFCSWLPLTSMRKAESCLALPSQKSKLDSKMSPL